MPVTVPQTSGFGPKLRDLRLAAGLTQKQLAEKAGLPQSGIAAWESETNEPRWPSVIALAEALGVTTDDFRPATS